MWGGLGDVDGKDVVGLFCKGPRNDLIRHLKII